MRLEKLLIRDDVQPDVKNIIEAYISETQKTQQALQESEYRYRYLIQTIPDIVYSLNENGIFTFVNDAVKELGYTPDELIGTHFTKLIHPADIKKVSSKDVLKKYKGKTPPKLFDERRTGQRKTTNLELRLIMKKGHSDSEFRETITKVAASGIYDKEVTSPDKTFLGTIGVIRDISDLKRTERELEKSRKQLQYLEKFLRVCASCHRIHLPETDDNQMANWRQMEDYITEKTATVFSHGLCPECYDKALKELKNYNF